MMTEIRNVIFDLGHVILNIDHRLMFQAFSDLGASDVKRSFMRAEENGLINQYARGQISSEEFEDQFQKTLNLQASHQEFVDAFNTMILDIPFERLMLLGKLRKKYRMFLLSNTNPIHLAKITPYITSLVEKGFGAYFEREYYSHLIGLLKPDPAAYNCVLEAHYLRASETILVDDALENIESAEKLGLKGLHITEKMTFEKAANYLLEGSIEQA